MPCIPLILSKRLKLCVANPLYWGMATNKKASGKKDTGSGTIALNRRARHDYAIDEKFEAGMVLQGWELKSIRAGKVQLVDSYVFLQRGEAFLSGANIVPLNSASTHVIAEPQRARKLLLHANELAMAGCVLAYQQVSPGADDDVVCMVQY